MKRMRISLFLLLLFTLSCSDNKTSNQIESKVIEGKSKTSDQFQIIEKWNSDSTSYHMTYKGPEFTKLGPFFIDDAHRTSTRFTHVISKFLKSNFQRKQFKKLDLQNLKVKFKGSPLFRHKSRKKIEYTISVPIQTVKHQKDAKTSIEHKGTWIRDYSRCNDHEFKAWKSRIMQKYNVAVLDTKLIDQNGFLELWLQW